MKPAPFKYFSPETEEEALSLLSEHGFEAKLLAGGQSLIPTMNFRLAQPGILIDLNRIANLAHIDASQSHLRMGAMTRQQAIETSQTVRQRAPLLSIAMPFIAHPQIRNRGTVGGSIVHADPAAELPAIMVATRAIFTLRSSAGEREVDADTFFTGLFSTALSPDEILVEIRVASFSPNTGYAFNEIARRHGDYALVGVAVRLALDKDGRCDQARIVFFSVGDGPVRALQAEALLLGERPDEELIEDAAQVAAARDIDPPGDIHASPDFRRHLARVLAAKSLRQAVERRS